jgi:hypothetical protein
MKAKREVKNRKKPLKLKSCRGKRVRTPSYNEGLFYKEKKLFVYARDSDA